jgi:AhpD family alkylhydroperoxidase
MTPTTQTSQTTYTIHTPESAPEHAGDALRALHASVGIIPNLAATMAESPALITGFLTLRELYATTGFTPAEVQVLSLTAAYENQCEYCVAFHTAMANKDGVSAGDVEALRRGAAPADARLGALSQFARAMVRQRGAVDRQTTDAFFAAGYSKRQALDVVMGMAFSLMANYAGHMTHAPLDAFLEPLAWTR